MLWICYHALTVEKLWSHSTGASDTEWAHCRPPSRARRGQSTIMCIIVWSWWPQMHSAVRRAPHLHRVWAQIPAAVRKRLSRFHCLRGSWKPGRARVGSSIRCLLRRADYKLMAKLKSNVRINVIHVLAMHVWLIVSLWVVMKST